MSSLIKIFKGAIYKDIYDLRADERKRTKYGVAEMIIDFSKTAPYIFNDSDKLYKNTTIVDDPYYETLCVINGEVRRPVYNGAHDKFEESSIEEYIEQLGQLCKEYNVIHRESRKNLKDDGNNIDLVRQYATNCIDFISNKLKYVFFEKYANDSKAKFSEISDKVFNDHFRNYEGIVAEISDELKTNTYKKTLELWENNSNNLKYKREYPYLKDDLSVLCEYAFYKPLIDSQSYNDFCLLRKGSNDKLDSDLQIIKNELKDKIQSKENAIKNELSKLIKELEDKFDNSSYDEIINDLEKDVKTKSFDDLLDIMEHNCENPKFLKKYKSIKDDYILLCKHVYFKHLANNIDNFVFDNSSKKSKIKELEVVYKLGDEVINMIISSHLQLKNEKVSDMPNKLFALHKNDYNRMIGKVSELLKEQSYDSLLEDKNKALVEQYPLLKMNYSLLCEYSFYQPLIEKTDLDSFYSIRKPSKDKIDGEIDKIIKNNKFDFNALKKQYETILEILKDK